MLPELKLALFDAYSCTFSHLNHVVRMLLAQASLLPLHAGDVFAVHSRITCRAQLKFAEKPASLIKELSLMTFFFIKGNLEAVKKIHAHFRHAFSEPSRHLVQSVFSLITGQLVTITYHQADETS